MLEAPEAPARPAQPFQPLLPQSPALFWFLSFCKYCISHILKVHFSTHACLAQPFQPLPQSPAFFGFIFIWGFRHNLACMTLMGSLGLGLMGLECFLI